MYLRYNKPLSSSIFVKRKIVGNGNILFWHSVKRQLLIKNECKQKFGGTVMEMLL